ncbi:AAA domain-containing protein [Devosia crocina]|uniref:AAA domain-containing protein n=1 Tax=Devosia crocina TaxID=429728 RepID=A0A1I7NQU4_9HYPH|nr:AAA family ATPase [Devosia crocina]SFV36958.1 AAA domain-containing protein [Devosia crocina]
MDLAGHIAIISGSPGSGKTTVAEALAHLPGSAKAHIHSDDFWGNIKHGHIPPWLPESDAQNRMVMQIAADVSGHYARHDYLAVLDGVVRPFWLPAFLALDLPVHYLVLRPSLEEAVARCTSRGGDSLTDAAVVTDLHGQFADLGDYQRHVIDTIGLDRAGTLSRVISALESGAYRLE